MYRVHNSTVSKQLRYSLTRESVHQPVTCNEASYAVAECKPRGKNRQEVLKLGKKYHLNSDVFKLKIKSYENSDTNLIIFIFTKSL